MQNVEREQIHTHIRTHTNANVYIVVVASLIIYIFCMASVFACFHCIFLLLLARVFTRVCIIFHLSESLYICMWVCTLGECVYVFCLHLCCG